MYMHVGAYIQHVYMYMCMCIMSATIIQYGVMDAAPQWNQRQAPSLYLQYTTY